MARPLIRLTVALAALWTHAALAAGLGPINVQSALGQPFAAEVDIIGLPAEPFEFDQAKGAIAGPEAYAQAKLPYLPMVRALRVTTEKRADGKPYLKIVGTAPINEPALNLLVDFNWREGRIQQKYSVLLDPPKS